ncbi:putative beta-glucosidase [Aspergillus ellipticus CBS 707.79]|uniref:beta-glucosidase n=1 Tax=Aspergillus ellipticus CBS 707.79 TaxID=1448320 RepID=A0A319CTQ6_9EURO|nr:putative beta-glucosidase [Aspergillus ellipticus CBS 707.79]
MLLLLFLILLSPLAQADSYHPPISSGYGNWSTAYEKARHFVCGLTLTEKVNLTTAVGTGQTLGYTLGIIPRLNFRGISNDDSPTGVRGTDYSSAFAPGLNLAMSWDRNLIYAQSYANGAEHKAKGINVALAPVSGPLGRSPEGGRNWEAFSPDPYLSGIAFGEAVSGMQASGAAAVGKHFILYEQEHFREVVEWNEWLAGPNITEPYSVTCDDRTFHELYLFPWYDAVHRGMAGVMCSYNQVNNTQVCQNDHLLNEVLKGELGFQGFVTSDDGSQHSGIDSALAGMDQTSPGETSPNGVDGFGESFWGPNLTLSVLNGSIPEWRLDDMVTRIMAAYYYLDQDDNYPELNFASSSLETYGYEYPKADVDWQQVNYHVDVRKNHSQIIRSVGANSAVLLKNTNNTLPLRRPKQIAIIGEDAGPSKYGPNGCEDRACVDGTVAMGWGSGTTNFPYLVDPLSAIQRRALEDGSVVQYVLDNWAIDQIGSVSSQASVCLTFINADSGEGYLEIDKNYGDRNNLTAWKRGDEMVKQVAVNCTQTVVIIHAPGPILMEEWIENPNVTAVLFAGFPGQESGNSLVDVLYGDVNPSGKLPWTVGKKRSDYSTDVLYEPNGLVPQLNFTEGLFIDYRHFDQSGIQPRFEFGYGLSYTNFSYHDIRIDEVLAPSATPSSSAASTAVNPSLCPSKSLNPSDYTFPATISSLTDYIYPYLAPSMTITTSLATPTVTIQPRTPSPQGGDPALYDVLYKVKVKVQNTGSVAGQEVSQLYLDLGNGEPVRQLRGFQKPLLKPGQTKDVTFDLRRRDVSIWDVVSQKWVEVTDLGTKIGVYVGASSRDLPLHDEISVSS